MQLEHHLSALLQLLHSWLNTQFQWIRQRQLQDETRNIQVWGFGVSYIRGFTVIMIHILMHSSAWWVIQWGFHGRWIQAVSDPWWGDPRMTGSGHLRLQPNWLVRDSDRKDSRMSHPKFPWLVEIWCFRISIFNPSRTKRSHNISQCLGSNAEYYLQVSNISRTFVGN